MIFNSASRKINVSSWGERPLQTLSTPMPKIIWSYWHDTTPPRSVQAAKRSWEIYAPDYEIRMLNGKTFEDVTGKTPWQLRIKKHAAISDWIRFQALRKYGGIWLDASLILLQPIENILPAGDILSGQPFMFYNRGWSDDQKKPMLESWLMTAPAGSELFDKAAREYKIACIHRKTYRRIMNWKLKTDLLQAYPKLSYFTCFAVIQAILRRNKHISVAMADSENGPYLIHRRLAYDSQKIATHILADNLCDIPAIKLNHVDRSALEAAWTAAGPDKKSPLSTMLK